MLFSPVCGSVVAFSLATAATASLDPLVEADAATSFAFAAATLAAAADDAAAADAAAEFDACVDLLGPNTLFAALFCAAAAAAEFDACVDLLGPNTLFAALFCAAAEFDASVALFAP